jgi:hypothetical protein
MIVVVIIRYIFLAIGALGALGFLLAIIESLVALAKKSKRGVLIHSNISVLAFVIMVFAGAISFGIGSKLDSRSLDIEALPDIKVESKSLNKGQWDNAIGKDAGSNLSPDLTWEPVDGCNWYAVVMIDHDAREFLHWVCFTDKTSLSLGEYGEDTGYIGPYPPAKHNYEIYVIAMESECEDISYRLNENGANLIWMIEAMDNKGNTRGHNVKAMGSIKGSYNPPKYIK